MAPDAPGVRVQEAHAADSRSVAVEKVRAAAFFGMSFLLLIATVFITALCMPLVLATDRYRRLLPHTLTNLWGKLSTSLFYEVQVHGRENLPPADRPVVYVANHQSFLDIYTLFHLDRPFKYISKKAIFKIPVLGWCMHMSGHVMLSRMDRRSQLECLNRCKELLEHDAPVLFFPEGARSEDGVIVGFKKGAFSVAVKAGVDIIPITLLGTGNLMRPGSESRLRSGRVEVFVHPAISTKGRTADDVCREARSTIASAMPAELVGSATKMAPDHA